MSLKTIFASSKVTPCFLVFICAFFKSHSNSIQHLFGNHWGRALLSFTSHPQQTITRSPVQQPVRLGVCCANSSCFAYRANYFARTYNVFWVEPTAVLSSVTKMSIIAFTRSESFLYPYTRESKSGCNLVK